jgi:hypothetical protein
MDALNITFGWIGVNRNSYTVACPNLVLIDYMALLRNFLNDINIRSAPTLQVRIIQH